MVERNEDPHTGSGRSDFLATREAGSRGPQDAPVVGGPERPLAGLGRAMCLAAAGGAALGAFEGLWVLTTESIRYARWGGRVPLAATGASALVAAALAAPCYLLAFALSGRPGHRAAPPSVAAGLGAILALLAFDLFHSLSNPGLVAVALAATLLFLALRELIAWWPLVGRATTWLALSAFGLTACVFWNVRLAHGGALPKLALAPAALGGLGILAALALRRPALALPNLALPAIGLLFDSASGYPRASSSSPHGPSVLHVSIDTLRPDRLGCYGNANARTPHIDRLADEGVLFLDTVAQANTTGPSHTTQLTGLYPAEHGALANMVRISPDVRTVPDLLAEQGYRTAAFVSGFTLVEAACGLASRFSYYDDNHLTWQWLPQAAEEVEVLNRIIFRLAARRGVWMTRSDRPAGWTTDAALAWLDSLDADEPFYLFLHYYDPHVPYEPPPPYAPEPARLREFDWYRLDTPERDALVADPEARAHMLALYDGEIAYADAQLGRILEGLERSGQLENTLVVLTSDHGEGLGSHGYWYDHGTFLYDEELKVPLVLRLPENEHAGTRVPGQTRLLDLAPTLLELCRLPVPELSGETLSPLFDGSHATDRPSFARAEMSGDVSSFSLVGRRLALRSEGIKLLWTSPHWLDTERIPERQQLFDLRQDPDELHDLYPSDPLRAQPLLEQLRQWNEATSTLVETGSPSPELLEHMRALGYL